MTKNDDLKSTKRCLKNTRAKLKRRDEKVARQDAMIARQNAKIAQMEEDAKKKALAQTTDRALQSIAKKYQDISSRNSLSDTPLRSDAKQTAALEILLRLLKD